MRQKEQILLFNQEDNIFHWADALPIVSDKDKIQTGLEKTRPAVARVSKKK